jgi:Nucleotidyl transferase AbiEii toxin, Type IV TA system
MMPVIELHRRVAVIGLRATAEHGFALGGGNALIAHGIIDRYTEDVDLFTDQESGVEAAADGLDPGLTYQDFADAGRRLDRMEDEAFTRYGLSSQDVAQLRERLADWPRVAPQRRADPDASPEPV